MARPKQAVVVIHGIGEQRPMDTLRGFVEAVLPDTIESSKSKYRNKPDRMSESFELRCLQAPSNKGLGRPITDFYEYYWAHHMRGSSYSAVVTWLFDLLRRPPWQIPAALRPLYYLSYVCLLTAAAILVWGLLAQPENKSLVASILTLYERKQFYFALLVLGLQWIGSYFLLSYVADAARYLTPSPDNIDERNKIRAEGIKLLRALHESKKYFRIIIVGHSLGSVIAYDIIRHLWVDMRRPRNPHPMKQEKAKEFDQVIEKLFPENEAAGTSKASAVELFQQAQHALWHEHRSASIPWLVTDFITLGAPLAHSSLLMADNPESFEQRKIEFEYPCCPPVSVQETHYLESYLVAEQPHPISVRIPHHGAPFSTTRWANLYFPYSKMLLGDLIGGPLHGVFGKGIRDVAVRPSNEGALQRTLYSHVCYWKKPTSANTSRKWEAGCADTITALQSALRLECLRSKEQWPEP